MNIFPFNLGLIKNTVKNLDTYFSDYSNKFYFLIGVCSIILLISFLNALQVNTTYTLRALQFISQENLNYLDLKSKKIRSSYLLLIIGVTFAFIFLASQSIDSLSISKILRQSNFYPFVPPTLMLFWWIFVALWGIFAAKNLLKKDTLLEKN